MSPQTRVVIDEAQHQPGSAHGSGHGDLEHVNEVQHPAGIAHGR